MQYFRPVQFGEAQQLCPELSFRFVRAVHILGSPMVELTLITNGQRRRLLFTGDIGRVRDRNIAPGKVLHSHRRRVRRRASLCWSLRTETVRTRRLIRDLRWRH